ncbi:hypothetical protein ACIQ6R_13415 [Streptomyces sp. NPDC096048]|uniref:hypothetical protein n=1 Tax=Streptomyces sp. NPDC096048 TaxID=3366072 RepID=UPI003813FC86
MTAPRKTMDEPVYLGMPLDEPTPVVHCRTCNQAARQREAARERDDPSAVTDANVIIRQHPHDRMDAR